MPNKINLPKASDCEGETTQIKSVSFVLATAVIDVGSAVAREILWLFLKEGGFPD